MKNPKPIDPKDAKLLPGVFIPVFLIYRIPGILAGSSTDLFQPVQVFMDRNTGKILKELAPKELHETIEQHNSKLIPGLN